MMPDPRATASLSLAFSREKGERPMRLLRQDPPWRVVRAFQTNGCECLVHIHNLSGGILSGDQLDLAVEVGAGSRVLLTSTGATRIYKHREDRFPASCRTRAFVGKNALLEYLPDQLIPYADSRFVLDTKIELAPEGAGLFWWETITSGRAGSGEKFSYASLRISSTVSCCQRPIAIDQFVLEPSRRPIQRQGLLGEFACCSTFYICKTGLADGQWAKLQAVLEDEAEEQSTVHMQWGASCLVRDGIVVRGVGMEASQLLAGLSRFWTLAKFHLYGTEAVLPRKVY